MNRHRGGDRYSDSDNDNDNASSYNNTIDNQDSSYPNRRPSRLSVNLINRYSDNGNNNNSSNYNRRSPNNYHSGGGERRRLVVPPHGSAGGDGGFRPMGGGGGSGDGGFRPMGGAGGGFMPIYQESPSLSLNISGRKRGFHGSSPEMAAGRGADARYVNVKTSVWWDIENCAVPRGCDPHAIAQNISSALARMNYRGPVSISAYGDTNGINSAAQQALSSTGVTLNHVPPGVKDASDKKILVDMLFWAVDNPAPANYMLISGDRDFSYALHQLGMRRYNVLLAQPKTASAPLVAAAKSVWLWTSLLAGGQPLAGGESQSKNYKSSPGTAQMKEPVDSYSEKPHVANQNSPSTARGDRWGGIQGNPSQTITPFYPTAPPPMPAGRYGTSFTIVPAFGSWSNFGHPANSSHQRRNPGPKRDPKNKPDSKNNKKPGGENSKGSRAGKGPELKRDPNKKPGGENKKKPGGENSKGSSCAGKGPELKRDPNKKPVSEDKKKPECKIKKVAIASKGVSMKKSVVPGSKSHVKQDKGKKHPPAAKVKARK